jgi:hypothetical protein
VESSPSTAEETGVTGREIESRLGGSYLEEKINKHLTQKGSSKISPDFGNFLPTGEISPNLVTLGIRDRRDLMNL